MIANQHVIETVFDYLGILPNSKLIEINQDGALFEQVAQKRDITYIHEQYSDKRQADWIIYASKKNPNAIPKEHNMNMAVLGSSHWSLLSYMKFRVSYKPSEIIRIQPATSGSDVFITSTDFINTLKRTYHEANLNIIGKCLVALKVALKPACFYPLYVFVR